MNGNAKFTELTISDGYITTSFTSYSVKPMWSLEVKEIDPIKGDAMLVTISIDFNFFLMPSTLISFPTNYLFEVTLFYNKTDIFQVDETMKSKA